MKQIEKVGILLAGGYTHKEIANMLNRSVHTINQETRILFQRTDSRNLADITRKTISGIFHIDIDGEISAMVKQIIVSAILTALFIASLAELQLSGRIGQLINDSFCSLQNLLK